MPYYFPAMAYYILILHKHIEKAIPLYRKVHFVFYGDLPEFKQYKIYHKNDAYSSILQKAIKV